MSSGIYLFSVRIPEDVGKTMFRIIPLIIFTVISFGVHKPVAVAQPTAMEHGLTAIAGVKVGHYTLETRPTGCTVILTEGGATATVDVRGASPGTRETALLDPVNTVQEVHAIVLSGGSAFGLAAADGLGAVERVFYHR